MPMHGQFGMLEPAISQCAIMLHASRLAKESNSHDAKPTQVLSSPCVWEIRTECQQQKKTLAFCEFQICKAILIYATTTSELLQPSNVSLFLVFVWGPVLDFENVLNTDTGFHILSIFARHGALRSCNEGGVNPNQPYCHHLGSQHTSNSKN